MRRRKPEPTKAEKVETLREHGLPAPTSGRGLACMCPRCGHDIDPYTTKLEHVVINGRYVIREHACEAG